MGSAVAVDPDSQELDQVVVVGGIVYVLDQEDSAPAVTVTVTVSVVVSAASS